MEVSCGLCSLVELFKSSTTKDTKDHKGKTDLFLPQCLKRIDARSPQCWNVACQQRNERQACRSGHVHRGIACADRMQRTCQHSPRSKRADDAEHETDNYQTRSRSKNQADNVVAG